MSRRRVVAVLVGAVLLGGGIVTLRHDVESSVRPVTGPDGERITAYHDPALITPPRPGASPNQPGQLHIDSRRRGAVVSWPPAPYGFDVRWGPAGRKQRVTRYVASPSIGLRDLEPGRYQVEVRSVDEVGRRSSPSSAEFEVRDEAPPWQQGLDFVEDFTESPDLSPERWRILDHTRECLRTEGDAGPLLLTVGCDGPLQPASPLLIADPGTADVGGRVVVVADTPPPSVVEREPVTPGHEPPGDPGPPDDPGPPNDLVIALSPKPLSAFSNPYGGIVLRAGSFGVFLTIGDGGMHEAAAPHRLDGPATSSPGALRRWELVLTEDQVQVHLDGRQLASIPHRISWRQAYLSVSALILGEGRPPPVTRVAMVGVSSVDPPKGAVELIDLATRDYLPAAEDRMPIAHVPTAEHGQLTGILVGAGSSAPNGAPAPPPAVHAMLGDRQLEVHQEFMTDQPGGSYTSSSFTVDLPGDAFTANTELTLRSVDAAVFLVVVVQLEVVHRPGTQLEVQRPRAERPRVPAVARPRLIVRQRENRIASARAVQPGTLDVEVRLDAISSQSAAGELAGFVALRVELGGRRILDFPTAADGPAISGTFRFTLDVRKLPAGGQENLVVSVIPDRPAVLGGTDRFVLKLAD